MVMLCQGCLKKFLAIAGVAAVLQLLPKNVKERARAPVGQQQDPLFLQGVGEKTDWWQKKKFKTALVLGHHRRRRGLGLTLCAALSQESPEFVRQFFELGVESSGIDFSLLPANAQANASVVVQQDGEWKKAKIAAVSGATMPTADTVMVTVGSESGHYDSEPVQVQLSAVRRRATKDEVKRVVAAGQDAYLLEAKLQGWAAAKEFLDPAGCGTGGASASRPAIARARTRPLTAARRAGPRVLLRGAPRC